MYNDTQFVIDVNFGFNLFCNYLSVGMWTSDYYDFLSQIDGDYE